MEKNGELYCLKWNQFQINIFSALESLHLSEDFADVTLYCDGTSHKAHKVILSACSPYFKTVFMEHPHCTHPVIILKGVSCEDLNSLLTYMYQGEVNIQRERLPEFMRTAKLLQVRGLTNCFDINPVLKTFNDKSKRQADDSNTDSDSSSHSKKRIRIRRKSASKITSDKDQTFETYSKSISTDVDEHNIDNISSERKGNLQNNDKNNDNNIKCDKTDNIIKNNNIFSDVTTPVIKIKQEICTDSMETQSVSSDYDVEGSILQRSLIGDHTVKPAESLVVTPDLPLSMNPLPTTVKIEPEEIKTTNCNSPQLPTVSIPSIYTKPLKKYSQTLTTSESAVSLKEKQLQMETDNFEDKLSNTLQLLKSNPQISVSREHLENINKKELKSNLKSKSAQYEIQPQISIEPMKHPVENNGDKHRIYSTSQQQQPASILAHNLTKLASSTKSSSSSYSSRNINIDRSSTQTKISTADTNIPQSDPNHQSSLSTLVQLFGQTQHTNSGNSGQSATGGQSWNCPHCQQLYHNQSALKYHVRLVHSDFNNRLCCYLCPNSFTMRESYKAHMLELHGIRH